MQSRSREARSSADRQSHGDAQSLTECERAEEKLYLIWRSGRLRGDPILLQLWANSLQRLSTEAGSLHYFPWLLQENPVVNNVARPGR